MKKWWRNRKDWQRILILFLTWRSSLFLIAWLGVGLISSRVEFLGEWSWANFDGVHYLLIAERGYGLFQQAFFPLYPILIRGLTVLTGSYFVSGMLISHLALLGTLFIFYSLVKLDHGQKIAWLTLVIWLFFPTSFYLGSVYTESLFLFLVLASFYMARRGLWWWSGCLGLLASATRVVGVLLFPVLLIEAYQQSRRVNFRKYWPIFLVPLGLLFYMLYLRQTFGDPLFFLHVQDDFAAGRSGEKLILLYQVFWRYLKMIMTTRWDLLYLIVWFEFLIGVIFLGWSLLALKKIRFSYALWAILSYLLPTLTGTFSSLPRYALAIFPVFILGAIFLAQHRYLRIIYLFVSGSLLLVFTLLFTRGYWVA